MFKGTDGCVWYLNNILIFRRNTKAENQAVVKKVEQQCVEHGLGVNLRNSEFHYHETIFLGHVIKRQKVKMDHVRLETMFK